MNICVFCGSKEGTGTEFMRIAKELGGEIAKRGHRLIYGGANIGLMGAVADACLENKGEVIGVMPKVLQHYEVSHEGLTELHWVENMHQRKALMESRADLFITLPGGVGTFEEFFEQFTWQQIGVHTKPIILFNHDGYYDLLIEFMQNVERSGFLREGDIQRLYIVSSVKEMIDQNLI